MRFIRYLLYRRWLREQERQQPRQQRTCSATTGNTIIINGVSHFRCELLTGHHSVWHERTSPPVRARWREYGNGGREFSGVMTSGLCGLW